MKREDVSLDELVLGLAPAHDWNFIYRRELYGAFDLTEAGLLALESHLRDIIASVSPDKTASEIVKVVFVGKPSEVYNSVSEVVALRNPRTERITGMNIRMINSEALLSMWLDDSGLYSSHSVVLLLAADSDTNFAKYEASVKKELKNLECWYSYGRKCFDRVLAVVGKVPPVVYGVLFLMGLASVIFSFFSDKARYAQGRIAAEKVLREYDNLSSGEPNLDPNIVAQVNEIRTRLTQYHSPGFPQLAVGVIRWMAYGFIGVVFAILVVYLFPRVVFEIGEGKKRQEQCVWLRRFVIGSIVFCGIILPRVLRAIH